MIDRLYGLEGAEYLQDDPEDVWERWWDDGGEGLVDIFEWSTTGYEQFAPSADRIAEWVAECMCEDVGFEEAGDRIMDMARGAEVTAAFQRAIDVLVRNCNEGGFVFADKILRKGKISTAVTDTGPEMMIIWYES